MKFACMVRTQRSLRSLHNVVANILLCSRLFDQYYKWPWFYDLIHHQDYVDHKKIKITQLNYKVNLNQHHHSDSNGKKNKVI